MPVVCPRRVSSFRNQVLFTVGDVWCLIRIFLTLAIGSCLVRLTGTIPWDLAWSFPSPRWAASHGYRAPSALSYHQPIPKLSWLPYLDEVQPVGQHRVARGVTVALPTSSGSHTSELSIACGPVQFSYPGKNSTTHRHPTIHPDYLSTIDI